MGPLFGGLICERTSWRWIFFINLPACGLAIPALYFSLKLPPRKRTTWQELSKTFDFIGLVLIMAGCACLVVGFASASDNGWGQKQTIALLVVGCVLFIASLVNFLVTKRNAILPPRILRTRTTVFWLLCSTLHATAFLSASFYFPVFYQGIENASPLMSGVSQDGTDVKGAIRTDTSTYRFTSCPSLWSYRSVQVSRLRSYCLLGLSLISTLQSLPASSIPAFESSDPLSGSAMPFRRLGTGCVSSTFSMEGESRTRS